jgi:hypothetical protein
LLWSAKAVTEARCCGTTIVAVFNVSLLLHQSRTLYISFINNLTVNLPTASISAGQVGMNCPAFVNCSYFPPSSGGIFSCYPLVTKKKKKKHDMADINNHNTLNLSLMMTFF